MLIYITKETPFFVNTNIFPLRSIVFLMMNFNMAFKCRQ